MIGTLQRDEAFLQLHLVFHRANKYAHGNRQPGKKWGVEWLVTHLNHLAGLNAAFEPLSRSEQTTIPDSEFICNISQSK
jgi:hypothetical protein